jgi:hypothetical protein
MPDKIAQFVLGDNLKNDDFDLIVNDREVEITVKRMSDTGDGFSTELGDYEEVGTLQGRVDNVSRYYQHQAAKMIDGDKKTNEVKFVGITRDSSLSVNVGDVWEVGDAELMVISLIGGQFQNRTEVLLAWFVDGVQIVNS